MDAAGVSIRMLKWKERKSPEHAYGLAERERVRERVRERERERERRKHYRWSPRHAPAPRRCHQSRLVRVQGHS